MDIDLAPKYIVGSDDYLYCEYYVDVKKKKLISVLFTYKYASLPVKGRNLLFTKFALNNYDSNNNNSNEYKAYLQNISKIKVKIIGGPNSVRLNWIIRKNKLLEDYIEYIRYVAERGLTEYECIRCFKI